MEVRPLRPEEALLYRDLRLRALAGAPDAFGDTLQHALARPEQTWIDRARELARNSDREILLMAWEQDRPCGSIFVSLEGGVAHIYGMWVDPDVRRRSIGAALVAQGLSFASKRQAHRAELWVTEGNLATFKLYERCGFRETGLKEPLRSGSTLLIRQMVIQLDDNAV
jgi:ribosomal protein S18 acetylase RimI-like enzyme